MFSSEKTLEKTKDCVSSSQIKRIVLTGGGTAGHVMPHLALYPQMQVLGWGVFYIGTNGLEKKIILGEGLPYFTIKAGKLRRYFSWQNLTDIFATLWGIFQAFFYLLQIKPQVVFSKGGFVSVPVAIAAWFLRIPVVTHESDLTPGLANKIIMRFSRKVLYAFSETKQYLKGVSSLEVGIPIRKDLMDGDKNKGHLLCGFQLEDPRPVVLVMGGSQGAQSINDVVVGSLPELLKKYRVIHITGKGKGNEIRCEGYWQCEFIQEDLKHLFCLADVVVGRAGANSIFEFLSLKKSMLLIPLVKGSRGDQLLNAESFSKRGWASVLAEEALNQDSFVTAIKTLLIREKKLVDNLTESHEKVEDKILSAIKSVVL